MFLRRREKALLRQDAKGRDTGKRPGVLRSVLAFALGVLFLIEEMYDRFLDWYYNEYEKADALHIYPSSADEPFENERDRQEAEAFPSRVLTRRR